MRNSSFLFECDRESVGLVIQITVTLFIEFEKSTLYSAKAVFPSVIICFNRMPSGILLKVMLSDTGLKGLLAEA